MKVFYDVRQVAFQDSSSPSAEKPKWVVEDWLAIPELDVELMPVEPVEREDFLRAHKASFVDGVLSCKENNGFSNKNAQVASALPWTSGSLLSACVWALSNQAAACSPTSGFHHAEWDKAMGFCTFNGLMVAAMAVRARGLAQTVGILDCDAHYGNGTDDIMARMGTDWITHRTMGARFQTRSDCVGRKFEAWLTEAVEAVSRCDLVIYQAGADPHVDDPYGGMQTSMEMSQRDRFVFEGLKTKPLVWNLAGGYQVDASKAFPERIAPVLALHRETAHWHIRTRGA